MDIDRLTKFLHQASMPHAHSTSNAKSMPDGSTTITFADGDWSFHDNFFGGEPYGGRAVIHYKQKPVWMMVYYGQVHDTGLKPDDVYTFLRSALQHAPIDKPYRGPDNFTQDNLTYRNKVEGNMRNYSGKEVILENGKEIFWTTYQGGLVDQQSGVGF